MNVIEHYDKLIDENNDPVHDPAPLRAYMDRWDGQGFMDAMELDPSKSVMEIGVGTGRLAVKVAPLCGRFLGVDISPKTVERAKENLREYGNVRLKCADFLTLDLEERFDVIYSSLTFMHVKEKQNFIDKVYSLLKPNGRFVLSVDKNQERELVFGDRKLEIYPDTPSDVKAYFALSKVELIDVFEVDFATVFVGAKTE